METKKKIVIIDFSGGVATLLAGRFSLISFQHVVDNFQNFLVEIPHGGVFLDDFLAH